VSVSSVWLFGYGSLIWRPGFEYQKRVRGFVEGFERRFWQGSVDHRGVVGAPGRVVTLVERAGASCWGVAYQVQQSVAEEVLERLDHREQGGYERVTLTFTAKDRAHGGRFEVLTYFAGPTNPNYLGDAPLSNIAAQVLASEGPSGHNVEYVLRLAEALDELGVEDPHTFELANLISEQDE